MAKSKKRKKKVPYSNVKIKTMHCYMCNGLAPVFILGDVSTDSIKDGSLFKCKQCGEQWVTEKIK